MCVGCESRLRERAHLNFRVLRSKEFCGRIACSICIYELTERGCLRLEVGIKSDWFLYVSCCLGSVHAIYTNGIVIIVFFAFLWYVAFFVDVFLQMYD